MARLTDRVEVVIRELEHKRVVFKEIASCSRLPSERRDATVREMAYKDALDSFKRAMKGYE